jgi:hypothetical protein
LKQTGDTMLDSEQVQTRKPELTGSFKLPGPGTGVMIHDLPESVSGSDTARAVSANGSDVLVTGKSLICLTSVTVTRMMS